ncbi:hypothetical protein H0E87_019393 [Populus deltoides]|uniref:Large ribosomal subunit protein bL32m n=1 Tax=Populus deltoides TaxID=3696 RepID=A0A8T2XUW2_POPDE|nr:hypothetical protein H0E87_019393 [Populus deltoides]
MALRLGMVKCAAEGNNGCRLGIRKWTHGVAMAPTLDGALESLIASPQCSLPEFDANQDTSKNSSDFGFTFPGFSFGGSMELMAVPKRKVTPHKRGIRNGPKALKPTPVIIRCKSCGQVKLPHFYCCSGDRGKNGMVAECIFHRAHYKMTPPLQEEGERDGHKPFNGLNLQSTDLSSKGDIEDQVIDVNALPQDGCRKFYTTQFLRESEEGGELEVESPGFDDSCAKKSCDTGVVTTNPLKSCSPSRDTPSGFSSVKDYSSVLYAILFSGFEDMDVGRGVETSNDFQPEKSTLNRVVMHLSDLITVSMGREHMESTIEMDRRNDYDQQESTHCPGVNEINATNYGNAHQEKDNLIDYKEDPLKILEGEKINNSLKSPLPTIKGVFKDSKE